MTNDRTRRAAKARRDKRAGYDAPPTADPAAPTLLCILCKTDGPAPAYGLGHVGEHVIPREDHR